MLFLTTQQQILTLFMRSKEKDTEITCNLTNYSKTYIILVQTLQMKFAYSAHFVAVFLMNTLASVQTAENNGECTLEVDKMINDKMILL
jgi:hypothetical protein